jgi:hypothetical protein
MSRWFRLYDDLLDDPKVQCLPAPLFRSWVNVLCVASKNGGRLPQTTQLAFLLRIKESDACLLLASLMQAGLIEKDCDGYFPHNWNARQWKSDDSKERVARLRKRRRSGDGNDGVTVTVTPPDNTEDTDIINQSVISSAERPRAARYPDDGAINYTEPFADIARRHGHGADINLLASAFRKFCRAQDIPLDDPLIARKFQTFCGKHKLGRIAA